MSATGLQLAKTAPIRYLLGLVTARTHAPASAALPVTPSVNEAATTPKKKILIVDDDIVILRTTSLKLKSHGYEVITASEGSAAIQMARREKPDLILLDLSFPPDVAHGGGVPWDGFLLMSWLRRLDEVRHVPVIVITGSEPARNKDRSLASGATAFFQKPLDHDELICLIKESVSETACAA